MDVCCGRAFFLRLRLPFGEVSSPFYVPPTLFGSGELCLRWLERLTGWKTGWKTGLLFCCFVVLFLGDGKGLRWVGEWLNGCEKGTRRRAIFFFDRRRFFSLCFSPCFVVSSFRGLVGLMSCCHFCPFFLGGEACCVACGIGATLLFTFSCERVDGIYLWCIRGFWWGWGVYSSEVFVDCCCWGECSVV